MIRNQYYSEILSDGIIPGTSFRFYKNNSVIYIDYFYGLTSINDLLAIPSLNDFEKDFILLNLRLFELGIKNDLANRGMAFNAASFEEIGFIFP